MDSLDILADQLVNTFRSEFKVPEPSPEREDFALYYKKILGWDLPSHLQLALPVMESSSRTAIILQPTGYGKTTFLAAYGAWSIGNNPNIRIQVATHTVDYSSSIIEFITTILSHPESKRIFGDLIPPKSSGNRWTTTERTVIRTEYRKKDPTLFAMGVGSSAMGWRCDLTLADDLVTLANSMSPTMRDHVYTWFYGTLIKRIDRGGRLRVIGARFYKNDLYGKIVESGVESIILKTTPENPLWPEIYPSEAVQDCKNDDYFSYCAQYLQEPIDLEGAFLREEWLDYYLSGNEPPNLRIYQGVDPCVRDRSGTDYLAIVTIGFDSNRTGYILDVLETQAKITQHKDIIMAQARIWNPTLIGIEVNGAQRVVYEELENAKKETGSTWPYLLEIQTQLPKGIRFASMGSLFKAKKILVPGVIEGGHLVPSSIAARFVQQWKDYPNPNDDVLDAAEHCLHTAIEVGITPASSTRGPLVLIEPKEEEKEQPIVRYKPKLRLGASIFH